MRSAGTGGWGAACETVGIEVGVSTVGVGGALRGRTLDSPALNSTVIHAGVPSLHDK